MSDVPMNERWTTVDRLFEAALDRAPADRAAFLREACPDDEALRQEVEALLTHATSAGDFLGRPAGAPSVARFTLMLPDGQQYTNTGRPVVAISRRHAHRVRCESA